MYFKYRTVIARCALRNVGTVVVVGAPVVKGLLSLMRVIREVIAAGVAASQGLAVINRAPRGPRARAEIAATLGELLALGGETSVPSPLHLSERPRVEAALRDGHRLTDPWLAPLAASVDRASVVLGKGVSVRVGPGGGRPRIKKNNNKNEEDS